MKYSEMNKMRKIIYLRSKLPVNVLSQFPWCSTDKVVYNYYRVSQLDYIAKYLLKVD